MNQIQPRNAGYWKLESPPDDGWELDSGYQLENQERAWQAQDTLEACGWETKIQQRATIEHRLPIDHPEYHPDQRFKAVRWCVFFKSK